MELETTTKEKSETQWISYFTHGSEDSLDLDRVYVFHEKPDNKFCYKFCNSEHIEDLKKEDRNIIVLDNNGYVSDCYYGTTDAITNCIYRTYSLHPQHFPNPIKVLVHRNVPLKVVKTIRLLLSKISKVPELKKQVSEALSERNFAKKLQILKSIDFNHASSIEVDDSKTIAFQMAQCISLIRGKEIFTKKESIQIFPDIYPFIKRDSSSFSSLFHVLENLKNSLLDLLEGVSIVQNGNLNLFYYPWNEKGKERGINWYIINCRGTVINMRNEETVNFPLTWDTESQDVISKPDWPLDLNLLSKIDPFSILSVFTVDGIIYCSSASRFIDLSPDLLFAIKSFHHFDFKKNYYLVLWNEEKKELNVIAKREKSSMQLIFM